VRALSYFRKALALTRDAAGRKDIQRRIQRLSATPVKVFVSTHPSGASVTVDGRQRPEPGVTPLVVHLAPGEHVLLLELEGHQLASERVVAKLGREQPVEVTLQPIAPPCPPPRPPCPEFRICPDELSLTDMDALHMQVSLVGAFGLTPDRPLSGGPGVQVYLTYKRIMIATHFLFFPVGETSLRGDITIPGSEEKTGQPILAERATITWMMLQLEGGYVFPFKNWFVYATGGVGLNTDLVVYSGEREIEEPDPSDPSGEKTIKRVLGDSFRKEKLGFVWSVGGGIQAMAFRWLSLGIAARFGVIHAKRANKDNPFEDDEGSVFPYGTFWGIATFHL
jgi:hypothetical protein